MDFRFPAREPLAMLPTPIQKLYRLSEKWDGPEIYVKRDDMTGMAVSGNKVRKLEFASAAARKEGADVLITCGGQQSNHARATAAVASIMGLKSHLVLSGEPTDLPQGNLFLDLLLGAKITYVPTEDLDSLTETMDVLAGEYRKKGNKPFIIPMGASNATGALGYVWLVRELTAQFDQLDFTPDYIIVPTGSGGTQAGLIIGKEIYRLSSKVIGINVRCDDAYFRREITRIFHEFRESYYSELKAGTDDIHTVGDYVGAGYAKTQPEEMVFIADVAKTEGLIVDPVYTGKAMYGLFNEIKKGNINKKHKVLFIHTGGLFGLMPFSNAFWKEVFSKKK